MVEVLAVRLAIRSGAFPGSRVFGPCFSCRCWEAPLGSREPGLLSSRCFFPAVGVRREFVSGGLFGGSGFWFGA